MTPATIEVAVATPQNCIIFLHILKCGTPLDSAFNSVQNDLSGSKNVEISWEEKVLAHEVYWHKVASVIFTKTIKHNFLLTLQALLRKKHIKQAMKMQF